ncbi:8500_t:CDS:2 [Paraglomus brasilianum]|uniref:8500_t:CDS:1 n=1 Tax=Paraglomus brasilianum TaxID=144538 RepID=A0A9N9CUG7_9GLOM|nr:8500_t:CDS:2 [Paraglomus brasilianum]
MSHSRALNDEEVIAEMKKMVAFINQEAIEKAREIRVKADEEFNIEKAKLVRQESINIEATFQRKIKQAEVQKKIAQSNFVNKSRLKILQTRQAHLEELFNETRNKLQEISVDQDKYTRLLKDLILEGLYAILDESVSLIVRKSDINLVQSVIPQVSTAYHAATKQKVDITIESDHHVPTSSAGGIILTSNHGRIRVNNTLEERLNLAQEEMLPETRVLLFGHSPNRKFFN